MARSLRGDLLSAADPAWLQRVCRGQALIYAGCVALVGGLALFFSLTALSLVLPAAANPGWWRVMPVSLIFLILVIPGATSLLLLLGAFATTTLDPRLSLTEQPIALRRFVRWSIVGLVALVICSYLVPTILKQLGADADVAGLCRTVLRYAMVLAFLASVLGISYYLASLAMRIPDNQLAEETRLHARKFTLWSVAAIGVTFLSRVSSPGSWPDFMEVIPIVFGFALFWHAFSLTRDWLAYRKVFKRCLAKAREHVAA